MRPLRALGTRIDLPLLLAAWGLGAVLVAAPALAQPPTLPAPKTTTPTLNLPAAGGSTTKPTTAPPKITAPPKAPLAKPTQPPASPGTPRTKPSGLPSHLTGHDDLRDKTTKGGGAVDRFGTGPSDASSPRSHRKGRKRKPGIGSSSPSPGSQGGALDTIRAGGSEDAAPEAGGQNDNPVRGLRNARVSNGGMNVWGGMDFETAHTTFLGSVGHIKEPDGRNVRIQAGIGADGDWVLVQVHDTKNDEHRRYEYVNGQLVQKETTDANGNKVATTIDPATDTSTTTVTCLVEPCPTGGRVNPDVIPRGAPPPAAADTRNPLPSREDMLIQYGPDAGKPRIVLDLDELPDPNQPLINPGRDGHVPRGEGTEGEGSGAGPRLDPLIQWAPGSEPHDDPPPASPGGPSGTKSPTGGDRKDAAGKGAAGKQGKRERSSRERPTRSGGARP